MLGDNGWHANKEDFLWESAEVRDVDKDKDKEGLIHPSPVSYSSMYLHLQTGGNNYFCQSPLLIPD